MTEPYKIELPEYETKSLPENSIPDYIGKYIFDKYSKQIDIEFPSYKTNYMWKLTNRGWGGYIPLLNGYGIYLKPKIQIADIFKMWEYAYKLKSFKFLDGAMKCDTLDGFYERLANLLADLVLEQERRGFYKEYKNELNESSYIRGHIDINSLSRKSWQPKVLCHFQEHSADILENKLITWTLYNILRTGICNENISSKIRAAYRNIQSVTSLVSFTPKVCDKILYNRLDQDYQPIHILCKFFLEHSGPSIDQGDNVMLPFLVNMPKLYEIFVAEWLKENLPDNIKLKAQENVQIGEFGKLNLKIDMVFFDAITMNPIAVLDTKYKNSDTPTQADINQIATYALSLNSYKAILVYPGQLKKPFIWNVNGITIQSLTFDIGENLEKAGNSFIEGILND